MLYNAQNSCSFYNSWMQIIFPSQEFSNPILFSQILHVDRSSYKNDFDWMSDCRSHSFLAIFFLYKDGAIINLGFVFFNSATMVFEKKIGSEILNFGSFSRIVVKELKRMRVIRLRTNRKVPYTVVWRGLHIN